MSEDHQHGNDMDNYMCPETCQVETNCNSTLGSNKSCEEDDSPDILLYSIDNNMNSERRGLEKSPMSLGKGEYVF